MNCFSRFFELRETRCSMHGGIAILDNLLNIKHRNSIIFGQKLLSCSIQCWAMAGVRVRDRGRISV